MRRPAFWRRASSMLLRKHALTSPLKTASNREAPKVFAVFIFLRLDAAGLRPRPPEPEEEVLELVVGEGQAEFGRRLARR